MKSTQFEVLFRFRRLVVRTVLIEAATFVGAQVWKLPDIA